MEIKKINNTQSDLVIELFDKYRVFYKQQSDLARLDNNESVIFVALIGFGSWLDVQ